MEPKLKRMKHSKKKLFSGLKTTNRDLEKKMKNLEIHVGLMMKDLERILRKFEDPRRWKWSGAK